MAENLVLEINERGDVTVVAVKGEVDLYTASALKERIADLVSAGRTRLAIDLAGVEFMDSTGLGVLIGGLKRCKEAGGWLALVAPREPVVKVLSITGLDKVFAIHEDVEQVGSSCPPATGSPSSSPPTRRSWRPRGCSPRPSPGTSRSRRTSSKT